MDEGSQHHVFNIARIKNEVQNLKIVIFVIGYVHVYI